MNDTVGQARDDVRARLAEIARRCGISTPQLRLVPGHAAASGCLWRADQPKIVLGTAQLRDLSAPGLDGTLAHECAHIVFGDPARARSRGSVAGAAVFFTSTVLGALAGAALVWLWLRTSLHVDATTVGILLGFFAGLVLGGALVAPWAQRGRPVSSAVLGASDGTRSCGPIFSPASWSVSTPWPPRYGKPWSTPIDHGWVGVPMRRCDR